MNLGPMGAVAAGLVALLPIIAALDFAVTFLFRVGVPASDRDVA